MDEQNLDWRRLYFGRVSPKEVQEAINDDEWQKLRKSLLGTSLETKYWVLINYLGIKNHLREVAPKEWRKVEVRVTNYVTALSRGGLIKPSDYRNIDT